MKSFYLFIILFFSFSSFSQEKQNLNFFFENGETISLTNTLNNNKAKVFVFWATYCIPCKYEMRGLVNLSENWYNDYNAEVYFVSLNNYGNQEYKNLKFIEKFNHLGQYQLFDPNRTIADFLDVQTSPTTFLFDSKGKLIQRWSGYDDGLERSIEMYFDKLSNENVMLN